MLCVQYGVFKLVCLAMRFSVRVCLMLMCSIMVSHCVIVLCVLAMCLQPCVSSLAR